MKLVEPRRSWRGRTWTPASLVEQPRWNWRGSTWTPSSDVFWASQACKGFACSTWRLLFLKGVNDRVAAGCVFVGGVSKRRSWIFFSLKTDSILLWAFYKMYIFWARENLRGKSQIDVFDESTQYFSSLFWMRSSLQQPTDIRRIFLKLLFRFFVNRVTMIFGFESGCIFVSWHWFFKDQKNFCN